MRLALGLVLLFLASMPIRDFIISEYQFGEGISWISAIAGLLILIVAVVGTTKE